jgi:hypothetical protein
MLFTECQYHFTRQICTSSAIFPRFPRFAECQLARHSVNRPCLPSAYRQGTRQTSRYRRTSVKSSFFFAECFFGTRQTFAEFPIENTRQTCFCRKTVCRVICAECICVFAECFWHSANQLSPVVRPLFLRGPIWSYTSPLVYKVENMWNCSKKN